MTDHLEVESPPELIVAPPAEWKRWAILAVVFALTIMIVPTQATANLFVHGISLSTDAAKNRSEIQLDYTNNGWNSIKVRDVRMMLEDREIVVDQPDSESIGHGGTGTLVVAIPTGECQEVTDTLQSLTFRVQVRPLGITRRLTPDLTGFEGLCE